MGCFELDKRKKERRVWMARVSVKEGKESDDVVLRCRR